MIMKYTNAVTNRGMIGVIKIQQGFRKHLHESLTHQLGTSGNSCTSHQLTSSGLQETAARVINSPARGFRKQLHESSTHQLGVSGNSCTSHQLTSSAGFRKQLHE